MKPVRDSRNIGDDSRFFSNSSRCCGLSLSGLPQALPGKIAEDWIGREPVAEAKKAGSACEDILLVPSLPILIGREASLLFVGQRHVENRFDARSQ